MFYTWSHPPMPLQKNFVDNFFYLKKTKPGWVGVSEVFLAKDQTFYGFFFGTLPLTISHSSFSPDRSWRCGQLGEDYPREQAKGAEGQQKVPRCAKVNCFPSSSFFTFFLGFVTLWPVAARSCMSSLLILRKCSIRPATFSSRYIINHYKGLQCIYRVFLASLFYLPSLEWQLISQCALANNVEHFKMVLESVSCTEEDLLFTDAETGQLEPLHCAYIFSTTMPMCVQSCGTLKALSEAPCCQLRISIYQHIDIDIDISAHNTVPPH